MSRRRLWDLGLFLLLLVVGAGLIRGCPQDSPEVRKKPADRPLAKPEASPNRIDLIALVDPGVDRVEGAWKIEEKVLVTPEVPFARCQIPYLPPEEYDLDLQVGRAAGKDSLNLGLVGGGRQFVVVLDGWTNGDLSGIEQAEGKPFFQNSTTYGGQLFRLFFGAKIHVSVRRASVSLSVDGKEIIRWKGDFGTFGFFKGWAVPESRCLFLGSYESSFRIEKMELIPVTGVGSFLR